MAEEKIFNTRISLKYDTFANWTKDGFDTTFKPRKGEVCITEVPIDGDATDIQQKPAILFKVGDGEQTLAQLDWVSARAADVYGWAKKATLDYNDLPETLKTIVSGDLKIGEKQYNSLKEYVDAKTAGVATDAALENINNEVTALKGRADALETVTGTHTTDIATIKDTYATKTEAQGYANAKDDAIAEAKKAGTDAQTAVEALSEKVGTVPEDKTVVQMITDAEKTAADAVQAHKDAVDAKLTTLIGTDTDKSVRTIANEELTKQLIPENAIESLDTLQEIAQWIQDHPASASAMNTQIEALEAIVAGIGGADDTSKTVKAYVDAAIAALNIGDYATAEALTTLAGRVKTNEDAITAINNETTGILTTAKGYTDEKITALNIDQYAKDADLAAIAKSGDVKDLAQTAGSYFILDCGSATTNI